VKLSGSGLLVRLDISVNGNSNHQIIMKTILSSRCVKVGSTIILGGVLLCGCAQYTAIKQPVPFRPTATVVGAKRVTVAGELGSPVSSEEETNHLLETYKYVDGGAKNNGASKTGRVILYSAGDLFTIFLDQILTWPAETYGFAGTTHIVTIEYSRGDDGYWQVKEIQDVVEGKKNESTSTNTPPAKVENSPTRR
jgi:hypothetical protein